VRQILTAILDFIRKPEWVAAVALLIQAVILFLQAWILREHGKTMAEHAGIAKGQANTADLIGKALERHAKILDEQTKLTDVQFEFQRRLEAHASWGRVYDQLLELNRAVIMMIAKIESPGHRLPERVAEEQMLQAELNAAILPVQKATITSLYLTDEEKDYFRRYLLDLQKTLSYDLQGKAHTLREFTTKYNDIWRWFVKAAEEPPEKHP
jgi:hypothetical protein